MSLERAGNGAHTQISATGGDSISTESSTSPWTELSPHMASHRRENQPRLEILSCGALTSLITALEFDLIS